MTPSLSKQARQDNICTWNNDDEHCSSLKTQHDCERRCAENPNCLGYEFRDSLVFNGNEIDRNHCQMGSRSCNGTHTIRKLPNKLDGAKFWDKQYPGEFPSSPVWSTEGGVLCSATTEWKTHLPSGKRYMFISAPERALVAAGPECDSIFPGSDLATFRSDKAYEFVQDLAQQHIGSLRGSYNRSSNRSLCEKGFSECYSFWMGCQPRDPDNGWVIRKFDDQRYAWPDGSSCFPGGDGYTSWATGQPGQLEFNLRSGNERGGHVYAMVRSDWYDDGGSGDELWLTKNFACEAPTPSWQFHGLHRYAIIPLSSTAAGASGKATSWNDAQNYCKSLGAVGGSLATTESFSEHNFIVSLVKSALKEAQLSAAAAPSGMDAIVWTGCPSDQKFHFWGAENATTQEFKESALLGQCNASALRVFGSNPRDVLCPMFVVKGTELLKASLYACNNQQSMATNAVNVSDPAQPVGIVCKAPAIKPLLASEGQANDYFAITVDDGSLLTAQSQCAAVGLPNISFTSATSEVEDRDRAGCVALVDNQKYSAGLMWLNGCACKPDDTAYVCKAPAPQRGPWRLHNNVLYSHFAGMKRSWHDARDECRLYGGDLARVTAPDVQSFIEETVLSQRTSVGAWVGCSDIEKEGSYVLTPVPEHNRTSAAAASPSMFTNEPCYIGDRWRSGQPDNRGREDEPQTSAANCMSLHPWHSASAEWVDSLCSNLKEFICMVQLSPNGDRSSHPNTVECDPSSSASLEAAKHSTDLPSNPNGMDAPPRENGNSGSKYGGSSSAASPDSDGVARAAPGTLAGGIAGGVVCVAVCLLLVAARKRGHENGVGIWEGLRIMRGGKEQRLLKEIAAIVNQRAQLTFLGTYSNKLFRNISSPEEYTALVESLEVPRRKLRFNGTVLGSGNYGEVRYATLTVDGANSAGGGESGDGGDGGDGSSSSTKSHCELAVKLRLPLEMDVTVDEALLVEALVLNALKHDNILGLVGVHTSSVPFLALTEYMPNGDLKSFLRACRPSQPKPKAAITLLDVALMTEKISSALAHLESVALVHRDVAARNILVGNQPSMVKLGDLGAARSVFRLADREYSATNDHNPARWMAPEALQSAKFSNKTDVWAFAVLCWEISTHAKTPYGAMSVRDMSVSTAAGNRLEFGPMVPPGLAKVVALCWSAEPKRRPHFADLVHQLGAIRGAVAVGPEATLVLDAFGELVQRGGRRQSSIGARNGRQATAAAAAAAVRTAVVGGTSYDLASPSNPTVQLNPAFSSAHQTSNSLAPVLSLAADGYVEDGYGQTPANKHPSGDGYEGYALPPPTPANKHPSGDGYEGYALPPPTPVATEAAAGGGSSTGVDAGSADGYELLPDNLAVVGTRSAGGTAPDAEGTYTDAGARTDAGAGPDTSNDGYEVVPDDLAVVSVDAAVPNDADRVKYRPIYIPRALLNTGDASSSTTTSAATTDNNAGLGTKRQLKSAGVGVGVGGAAVGTAAGIVDGGSVENALPALELEQRPRVVSAGRKSENRAKEVLDDDESRL